LRSQTPPCEEMPQAPARSKSRHARTSICQDRTGQSAEGTICRTSHASTGWDTAARGARSGTTGPPNHAVPASPPLQPARPHPIGLRAPSGRLFHCGQDGNECRAHHESMRAGRPRSHPCHPCHAPKQADRKLLGRERMPPARPRAMMTSQPSQRFSQPRSTPRPCIIAGTPTISANRTLPRRVGIRHAGLDWRKPPGVAWAVGREG
jgi:hypothetical protein